MCGILAVIGKGSLEIAERNALKLSHRGPDQMGSEVSERGHILCHQRLSIMDPKGGKQPLKGEGDTYLIHNGEIYNHIELREQLKCPERIKTSSDSEIILRLFEEKGESFVGDLDGVFAFVAVSGDHIFVGRDPIGVKPLFYGSDAEGNLWFASEVKGLQEKCLDIQEFPPGHTYSSIHGFKKYFTPEWLSGKRTASQHLKLKDSFVVAVKKRLMSDVPLGVLLSGGLDSSLVASVAAREMKKLGKTIKSFSVGIASDSKDLGAARKVAEFIGTEHHEVLFSPKEAVQLLGEVIHKIESYDVTTIRASTPMYIMSKYIADQGVKVVLSGEGADEIFGGYLYFHKAPDAEEFHGECIRRVKRLHTSDVLRADRSTMGAAVEARVPFLDKGFLEVAMNIDPELKTILPGERMEKHVLRQAFDDIESPYLPDEILWRQKEQFSDGVGYSWVDTLKELAEETVSDSEFAEREKLFPHNTPTTKEAFFYRKIYASHFPHKEAEKTVKKWIPKWQDYDVDPSGRANKFHTSTYHTPEEQKVAL